MTKKEYCLKNPVVAYYSGYPAIEIHGFEHDIEDYLYCSFREANGKRSYHKLKVQYGTKDSFVVLHGYRISLSECLRV